MFENNMLFGVNCFVCLIQIAMPDFSNYMLASEESLQDLNSKLGQPLPMKQFRANIIVSGTKPFGEVSVCNL